MDKLAPSDWITIMTFLGTVLFAFATGLASLVWWLSKQFSAVRELVFRKIENLEDAIIQKLEYHERHDDNRFSQITNDLWELRVAAAARESIARGKEKTENPDRGSAAKETAV